MTQPLMASAVRAALQHRADPARAKHVARFFKCGPGEYGEGDVFIGVTVPAQRAVSRVFRDLPLKDIDALLRSRIHEERLTALLIMVDQFARHDRRRGAIFKLYVRRLQRINNWDLVDVSAAPIVGGWLEQRPRDLLDKLARSKHLWSRRVAMIATYQFIKQGDADDAIRIANIQVHDTHDLIHKAVGWMLREVDKRASPDALNAFLTRHAATMPRTMLRYAIERLPKRRRSFWMGAATRKQS
jgi:3-methyladenine DNA glycosylase AlkD